MAGKIAKYFLYVLISSLVLSVFIMFISIMIVMDDLPYLNSMMGQYVTSMSVDETQLAMGIVEYPGSEEIQKEFQSFFYARFNDQSTEGMNISNGTDYGGGLGNALTSVKYTFPLKGIYKSVSAELTTINSTGATKSNGDLKPEAVQVVTTYNIKVFFGPVTAILPLDLKQNYKLFGDEYN